MKCAFKNEIAAVFDDVFETDAFNYFVGFYNSQEFMFRSSGVWQKIWRINDGEFLAGAEIDSRQLPVNNCYDWLHQQVYGLATQHVQDIVGKEGEAWDHIVYRPYIYPVGSKISWHDDYGYSAACIFYCHREWSPFWGGELMIASTPSIDTIDTSQGGDDQINRKFSKELLNHFGYGMYFGCNPNRLVFSKGGAWHAINRVDTSAGEHVRASVVAFFKKSCPSEPAVQPSQS